MSDPSRVHRVVMFVYADAQILDVTGPLEVFGRTGRWLKDHGLTEDLGYEVELVAATAGPLRTSSGLELMVRRRCSEIDPSEIGTFLITGGIGYGRALEAEGLVEWLREVWQTAPRVGSICTGALVAARAGLLEGPATTHWAYCAELAASGVEVSSDALFVKSGRVYTSAGVTTGMDMALAMVEEDWGQPVALAVAQELVLYLKRPGGQSQFSRILAAQMTESSRFQQLCLWIQENLDRDLRVPSLARRANLSVRHFTRRFADEVGLPPGEYVQQVRLEAARRKLEASSLSVKEVGSSCGYASCEQMRRMFHRGLGISPSDYRQRFASPARPSEGH